MKIVQKFYPEFGFMGRDNKKDMPYGKGHTTPEAAFAEGLQHTSQFPNGEMIVVGGEKINRYFRNFVVSKYSQE